MIFLTSSQAPSVIVQMSGLGSKKQELRVGMSVSELQAVINGQVPDRIPQTLDDPNNRYVAYPHLGLAFRFANERVQEIAIMHVPLAKKTP